MLRTKFNLSQGGHLSIGDDIGDFRVTASIESTRYGILLRARHRVNGDNHFVFVFPFFSDREFIQRIEDSARALARFNTPGIIKVGPLQDENGIHFIASGPVRTPSIEELVKSRGGKLSPVEAKQVLLSVCKVVTAVHKVGLVHGSLSPAKIHWAEDLGTEVVGFGWHQVLQKSLDPILSNSTKPKSDGLATGDLDFSLAEYRHFWSPEWHNRQELDAHADQYSMGSLAHYLLTGSAEAVGTKMLQSSQGIGESWNIFLKTALNLNPKRRFFSSEKMLKDTEALSFKRSTSFRHVLVGSVLLIAGALGIFFFLRLKNSNEGALEKSTEQAPSKASWTIESEPAGAKVSINGSPVGTTPYLSVDQFLGTKHELTLTLDGYESLRSEVLIDVSQRLSQFKLIPLPAKAVAPPQEPASLFLPLPGVKPIEFVRIAPGTLVIAGGTIKERKVGLNGLIYVAVTELTQAQLVAVGAVENNSSLNWRYRPNATATSRFGEFPANRISFSDAAKIIETLRAAQNNSELSAYLADFPTESEWEYLARSGLSNEILDVGEFSNAVVEQNNPESVTARKPNGFGLYGMFGNVSEWCYIASNSDRMLNFGQAVVRGGYWAGGTNAAQPDARVIYTTSSKQTVELERCGLRLILRKKTP